MRPAERKDVPFVAFLLCAGIFVMQTGFFAAHKRSVAPVLQVTEESESKWFPSFSSPSDGIIHEHPIPKLIQDAEVKFRKKVESQSKTLKAAVQQYKKRYGIPPPKGFEKWWEFAQKYNVVMTDEYDGLMEDIAPFRGLSGTEFRRRVEQVATLPSMDLVRIRNGNGSIVNMEKGFEDSEFSARARGFLAMTGKFRHELPDMNFAVNAKAESRVIVSWEHKLYPNLTKEDSSEGIESVLGGPFIPDWRGDGNVWESWRRSCHPSSPARRLFSSLRNPFVQKSRNLLVKSAKAIGDEFKFPEGTSYDIDFCIMPHAHYNQGHFFSDWRTIPALYPVLSPARARGFMDIKIPSHYYYGSTKRYTYGWDPVNFELKKVDPMEVPWEEKSDKIFWRGADTGGGNSPPNFCPRYQRHRFLRMTSETSASNRTITFADIPGVTQYISAHVPTKKLNEEIMDVAFVKATNPKGYPGGLEALKKDHRFADSVPLGKHWAYKYLVDFDGMSYSGRFLSFLASDSVPIKSTVYREFFSDWIQPWVHFIPLSASYKEIYNIHAYFNGPSQAALEAALDSSHAPASEMVSIGKRKTAGEDAQLRRIARAGKQWKQTIGRTLDMEAYVYRLCLEWARLYADDRESMNYSS